MDGDGVIEISLASPHLYGDGETLDDLVGALTNDMEAHNSFFGTLHNKLEGGGLLVVFLDHAEVEGLEGGFVWAQASLNMVVRRRIKNRVDVQIFTASPYFFLACGSVRPTVPTGGWLSNHGKGVS